MPSSNAIAELLAAKEMVVVCGSGGTGKTTVAAALGAQAAVVLGGHVLVLTVDPARRLATALGIGAVGNTPVEVPTDRLSASPRGQLSVAMLDTKAGWDELIERHAPSADVAARVLANPLYRNITGRFVHSHDYIAMERLHELHASGVYDLVIIDTPPSRNALELLDAPGRMRDFFGSKLLRWLTVPARSKLLTVASQPFYQVADRVLGSRFLRDIAEFFSLFQTMERGFVQRADEVERLLLDDRTTFIVVSTLEGAPAYEARVLADELRRRGHPLGAVVANRVLPESIRTAAAAKAAKQMAVADEQRVAVSAEQAGVRPDVAVAVLRQVGERFPDIAVVAAREAERRRELVALGVTVADVPLMDGDVTDLDALMHVGLALLG